MSPQLTDLDLSWCEDITDNGMATVAASCRNLRHLGLRQCAAAENTLNSLAACCHFMTSLNIAGMDHLDDDIVVALATNMPLLVDADLSWNSSLTDNAIQALLLHCTRLRETVLSGLKLITSRPFLGIICDLGRWHLVQDVLMYRKRRASQHGHPPIYLKSCDVVSPFSTLE